MLRKELKKLNRRELVDVIYQMKKNEQRMQEKIASLEAALQDRRMRISKAGSIAEAAATITNVFSAAQETADMYLQEIVCMKAEAEQECTKIIQEARKKAAKICPDGEKLPRHKAPEHQTRKAHPKHARRES